MSAALNTTTEAEGLPRRRFTFEEVERMVTFGILQEHERIELIGGEIVPMWPKEGLHEVLTRTAAMGFRLRHAGSLTCRS